MILFNLEPSITKRILNLFRPFVKQIVFILVCMVISLGISMVLPLISKQIMDEGLLKKNFNLILKFSLFSFFIILLQRSVSVLETRFRAHINALMSYNLSKAAFKHLLKQKIQFFNNANTTEIINNIGIDVSNICRVSDRSTFFVLTETFRVVGGVIGLLLIDWKLTLLVICMIPLRYLLVQHMAKKRNELFEKFIEHNRQYSSWFGDTVGGIKEIKLWGMDRVKIGQFIRKQRNLIKSNINIALMDSVNSFSESVMMEFIANGLYILGGYMMFRSDLTVGGLFAFITYSMYVTGPIFSILNIGYNFAGIVPSAKRLFSFMDMECEEASEKKVLINKASIKGNIKFDHVTFSYNKERILDDISLEFNSGERVALIGPNGSGKSSIINLALRLYKPDKGRILLDGIDINNIGLKEYRSILSVVSQDVYLFDTTIKENISLSYPVPDAMVCKAARESGASKFIDALPEKYEYVVGRNGSKLSGGERQKIAVARAFARESRIVILDEATSNYDIESEIQLNRHIRDKYKDRTIIVISHKPEILKMVDRIIMIENGRVVDEGKHEELLKRNFSYRELVDSSNNTSKKVV